MSPGISLKMFLVKLLVVSSSLLFLVEGFSVRSLVCVSSRINQEPCCQISNLNDTVTLGIFCMYSTLLVMSLTFHFLSISSYSHVYDVTLETFDPKENQTIINILFTTFFFQFIRNNNQQHRIEILPIRRNGR